MKIYLLRHGQTSYNEEKRYQGALDIPLSEKGLEELIRADISPKKVYVSPLNRARSTADVLFPEAEQIVVQDFREMCFGVFEGRNFREMEHDAEYIAWVESGCEGRCPGGEQKAEFCERTCEAFEPLMEEALQNGEEKLVILAHGGTQMAIMERYALPHDEYYHWRAPNGGGYVLEADGKIWRKDRTLTLAGEVQYIRAESGQKPEEGGRKA